jgi:hypothetical protein
MVRYVSIICLQISLITKILPHLDLRLNLEAINRMTMKKQFIIVFILILSTLGPLVAQKEVIDLSGTWGFQLDPNDFERAFENSGAHRDLLADKVTLPGTTDSNRKGIPTTNKPINRLSRYFEYTGPAWYQKDIVIPEEWRGKSVQLFFERILWISSVYIDGKLAGTEKSFSTPHRYDLTALLVPGKHRLTVCVDNRVGPEFDRWSHAFSEYTQTCWNGIVGRMELRAFNPVHLKSIKVYPDLKTKSVKVKCVLANQTGSPVSGTLFLSAKSVNSAISHQTPEFTIPFAGEGEEFVSETELQLGPSAQLWDDFTPALYELTIYLAGTTDRRSIADVRTVTFGMREVGTEGAHFTLNGRRIFLRGTLECAIFPLTGYPDMTVDGWLRICRTVKSYGLNHIRFHSWCPPEEAFTAADQTGILLQVELPFWSEATQPTDPLCVFLKDEMGRILERYGNHPSFAYLCMGNELRGNFDFMADLVRYGKETDNRHLYSGSTARKHLPEDQFYVSHQTAAGTITTYGARGPQTDYDLRKAYEVLKVPGVAHEVGQRAVYPNFDEIAKYTGLLFPRNFELFRDSLTKHGMLDQANDFFRVSGNMTVMLYKESIEALLRTPNSGGFQLLDLHDFPGQGTALVGILDPFWDSKGFITPDKWSEFCGPVVPILRMPKREYSTAETFTATAEISNYSKDPLVGNDLRWEMKTAGNKVVASGRFKKQIIPVSSLTFIGEIKASLSRVPAPEKVTVIVYAGNSVKNEWDIWVYSDMDSGIEESALVTCRKFDQEALTALRSGKNVLLLPDIKQLNGKKGSFQNHFWCPIMFRWEPMTMGTLVRNEHPAFRYFPSDYYTGWQWWNIISNSVTLDLDGTPAGFRPLLQSIDTYDRCQKQGIIFEAKVEKGKLLMAAIDFEGSNSDKPAARQLLYSMRKYASSDEFNPDKELTSASIQAMFKKPTLTAGARIIRCDSYETGNEPDKIIDDDYASIWHTAYDNPGNFAATNRQAEADYPHEVQIELQTQTTIRGVVLHPRKDGRNGWIARYEFFVSNDGENWGSPVAAGQLAQTDKPQQVLFPSIQKAKFIRLVALKGFGGQKWASLAELELLGE